MAVEWLNHNARLLEQPSVAPVSPGVSGRTQGLERQSDFSQLSLGVQILPASGYSAQGVFCMLTRRVAYLVDRGASVIVEVVMVLFLAMAMPLILVVAVVLAMYGDIAGKRNRWTGLDLVKESVE